MIARIAWSRAVWLLAAALGGACRERDAAPLERAALGGRRPDTTSANGRSSAAPRDSGVAPSPRVTRDTSLAPGALALVPTGPVTLWKGPGGLPFEVTLRTADPTTALARRFGTITLRTSLRTRAADLGQYPCTSCHLGRATPLADERKPDAHRNIKAVHPVQTGGVCSTCHAPDNVELLALKSGERATLDHAYRLCAQCHFSQAEAWAGGGHGKRLDGWQGRRVVMGCADCHDPHKPALEQRIPFRGPVLERPRGPRP